MVVNLTGRGNASCDMQAAGGRLRLCFQVVERNVREEDAAATLEWIAQGRLARSVLPWIPLMHGGGKAGMIERWKVVADGEPDQRRRADYGALAKALAPAAGRKEVWDQALEGWAMKESPFLLEVERKASAREQVRSVLDALAFRFPPGAPSELAERIKAVSEEDRLRELHRLAVTSPSFEDFRRATGL